MRLDYNPLATEQVPLVNGAVTTQGFIPPGFDAEQPTCCPDFLAGPSLEPIGSSLLRKFDPDTGLQLVDERGIPQIVRSPQRPVAVALFVHTDGTTSGLVPGIPVLPFIANAPATAGTFYVLGLFPIEAIEAIEMP